MSTEEPAWKAELRSDIRRALAESDGYELDWLEPYDYQDEASAILLVFDKHIQAAEERGRREALKEHIKGLKADWARFRGRVLQEAWEAMRDAEDGPLTDAMGVINDLLEKK